MESVHLKRIFSILYVSKLQALQKALKQLSLASISLPALKDWMIQSLQTLNEPQYPDTYVQKTLSKDVVL